MVLKEDLKNLYWCFVLSIRLILICIGKFKFLPREFLLNIRFKMVFWPYGKPCSNGVYYASLPSQYDIFFKFSSWDELCAFPWNVRYFRKYVQISPNKERV